MTHDQTASRRFRNADNDGYGPAYISRKSDTTEGSCLPWAPVAPPPQVPCLSWSFPSCPGQERHHHPKLPKMIVDWMM
jgi:hypothetical protein